MSKRLLILALALSGCAQTLPVDTGQALPPQVPAIPPSLSKRATALPQLTDPSLAGLERDAIETDRRYNDVALQLNSVLDAWDCVRSALNDHKDINECLKESLRVTSLQRF